MTQRLIIHIGTPKTGSSSLQRALHDGAYSSHGVRVAYPDRLSEVDLARAMARGRETFVARRLGDIQHWLSTGDADVFALSSEQFVGVPAGTFAAAMQRHLPGWADRAQVVCYLRPHGPRLVSAFAQQRKSGAFLGSMDKFLQVFERNKRLRYADQLAAWREVYGERLVARQMTRSSLVGGDVVTDFLHLVTSGEPVEVHAPRLNPSLSVESLALLRIVHRALRAGDVPDGIAQRIGKRIAADLQAAGVTDHGHRLWVSTSQAESIATIFAEDAARLDATLFPDSGPFTDDLRRLVAEAPAEAPDLQAASYADGPTRKAIRRDAATLAEVCSEHGSAWVAQFRADKGYRYSEAAIRPESAARVEAALEPVVIGLAAALRQSR